MAEKKKSIIDEAVLDAKRIQETLNANTKEILRSIAKEEIDDLVKESLNEFEEEDVDDTEVVDTDAVDAEVEATDDMGDIEDESGEEMTGSEEDLAVEPVGDLDGMGAEEVPSGEEIDMTTASDEEVVAVYKKLTGDDEIQIVSNEAGDIELTVNEPGEFVIKANDEAGEVEDMEDMEAEVPAVDSMEDETEMEEETYEEGYDVNESQVVYEIAIDEMEDIESVSAPVGNKNEDNWAGDNLEGGFDDNGQNGSGDNHGEHIMEDENVTEGEEVTESEEVSEEVVEEDTVDETKYVGGKVKRVATAHTNQKLANESTEYVSKADYDKLLAEAKSLKKKATEMASTLQEQRKMLGKVVVFNTNLTNVTRLFTEHSTTKDEKRAIIERFDDEVSSIQESKRLFKTIEKELSNKAPISESVEEKISKEKSSSSSKLNESTAYVDQGTKRIMNLINRVENPDKY
jgi:hypothetical protein